VGTRCADHVTPLYPQKLALTSPTGGGRSVGIVRMRTKATEFSLVYIAFISLEGGACIFLRHFVTCLFAQTNALSLFSGVCVSN